MKNVRLYKIVRVTLENVVSGQVCSSFSFHSPSPKGFDSKSAGIEDTFVKDRFVSLKLRACIIIISGDISMTVTAFHQLDFSGFFLRTFHLI